LVSSAQHSTHCSKQLEKQLGTTGKQLGTTSAQVAADDSLGKRMRDLFASIGLNILREIDSGHFDLTIRMQPSDIEQLQKLRERPGGGDLVSIIGFGRRWTHSIISNGTLGPSTSVPRQTEVTVKVSKALPPANSASPVSDRTISVIFHCTFARAACAAARQKASV
jgi:hypothetical protein